jgi:FkbM family methyltransferase
MRNQLSYLRRLLGKGREAAEDVSPLSRYVGATLPKGRTLRLGSEYGGWIIPAEPGLDENSVCYLAGAGEDISFDCSLVQSFGCRVRIIDPTPRAIEHFRQLGEAVQAGRRFPINNSATEFYDITPTQLARVSFLPVGLAERDVELKFFLPKDPAHVSCSTVNLHQTEDYFSAQCHNLATIMAQQGDTHVDLLKMDIEGAEYPVIRDLVAKGLLPRILLVEFDEVHSPLDGDASTRIADGIRQIVGAGMRCIAVEGSNATFVKER